MSAATIESLRSALVERFPGAIIAPPEPLRSVVNPQDSIQPQSSTQPQPSIQSLSTNPLSAPPEPADSPLAGGRVTEILGAPGAGGCTLVLQHLAQLLAVGDRYAAFIDLVGELYPPAFVEHGVPLQRLLLIRGLSGGAGATGQLQRRGGLWTPAHRAGDWPIILRVMEALLRGGATRLVCVDVPPRTPPMRLSTYHRLRRRVRDTGCALVFLSPDPFVPADHRVELRGAPPARVDGASRRAKASYRDHETPRGARSGTLLRPLPE